MPAQLFNSKAIQIIHVSLAAPIDLPLIVFIEVAQNSITKASARADIGLRNDPDGSQVGSHSWRVAMVLERPLPRKYSPAHSLNEQ